MWISPPRNLRPELLDLDCASYEEVEDSLADVRRVNRWLGGYRTLLAHATPFLKSHRSRNPFTVLDLATGSADQPEALVRLARSLDIPIRVTALDINAKMIRMARARALPNGEIRFIQGDIHRLPVRESRFDLVINCLSLHHFTAEQAVAILAAMHRLCRRGLIVNDLRRSRVACAAIYLLTRLLTRNRLTRNDAPVSVMNAFTPEELAGMARTAGIRDFTVYRHFPYRLALVAEKKTDSPNAATLDDHEEA